MSELLIIEAKYCMILKIQKKFQNYNFLINKIF